MEALIVNNGEHYPQRLHDLLAGWTVRVVPYNAITQELHVNLVVLSGSSSFPIVGNEDVLEKELDLIRTICAPLIGICYGFELIVRAFGGTLKALPEKQKGIVSLDLIEHDPIFEGFKKLDVFEAHRFVADSIPPVLVPLARSPHGIEAVRHRSKFLYGFGFHPEKCTEETIGDELFYRFLNRLPSTTMTL